MERGGSPGECAWADRPVSPDEPNVLDLGGETRWYPTMFACNAATRLSTIAFEGESADAERLFSWGATEDQLFYVHCFNPPWARGVLIVTRVGP